MLEAIRDHEEKDTDKLIALGVTLAKLRSEAIAARKDSGIEDVWLKAEEAYLGIDDANRASFAGARWAKPTNMTGGLTKEGGRTKAVETKSSAFFRLTSRYVDAGAAKTSEILLPADEKAFSFSNTPVPDLVNALKDTSQAIHNGTPLTREAPPPMPGAGNAPGAPSPAPQAGMPPTAPGPNSGTNVPNSGTVPVTVKDVAEEAIAVAQASAKKAEKRIHDWMVQSQYRAEGRKVVFDCARIGVGVLKGPFPRKSVTRALSDDKKSVRIVTKTVPAYAWVDPWNIYPADGCGENIKNGDHIFEVDPFSSKQLRGLKGLPGYIDSAIDKVLKEGPSGTSEHQQKPGERAHKNRFFVWYFYGILSRDDMVAAGCEDVNAEKEKDKKEFYAICTMVNDTVIRATINPLDSGEFPYHAVPWQRRPGQWAGVGVGEQIEMPQSAINAAIRTMFNNAGKSAGSIIVVDKGSITPGDLSWEITPDKIFNKAADATSDDVRKAFTFFSVPNMTPQLMTIIEFCLRAAEESTNIPLVTQGQSGTTTPETFGATQLQNNNANQLLRAIGYQFDDYITEPVVNQSYEYLLLDPEIPEDEKGDWKIDAHGSVALVERAIQDQTITQMSAFVTQPAFGVNPKKWFAEFSKTKHLNPKNFQYSPEEQAKIDSMPAPAAPAIEVAKIKVADAQQARQLEQQQAQVDAQIAQALEKASNDTKLQIAAMRKEVDELRVKKDTDRDSVYVQAETARTTAEFQARREELALRRELALLEYANKKELSLDQVKKDLAETTMKLQVQKELSGLDAAVQIRKHDTPDVQEVIPPEAEPAGKAESGKAFTQ